MNGIKCCIYSCGSASPPAFAVLLPRVAVHAEQATLVHLPVYTVLYMQSRLASAHGVVMVKFLLCKVLTICVHNRRARRLAARPPLLIPAAAAKKDQTVAVRSDIVFLPFLLHQARTSTHGRGARRMQRVYHGSREMHVYVRQVT